jgi:hypothetical protein
MNWLRSAIIFLARLLGLASAPGDEAIMLPAELADTEDSAERTERLYQEGN